MELIELLKSIVRRRTDRRRVETLARSLQELHPRSNGTARHHTRRERKLTPRATPWLRVRAGAKNNEREDCRGQTGHGESSRRGWHEHFTAFGRSEGVRFPECFFAATKEVGSEIRQGDSHTPASLGPVCGVVFVLSRDSQTDSPIY